MNTIRIAIDGNEANVTQRVGSNVYAFALLRELHAHAEADPLLECTVLLASEPVSDLPAEHARWRYVVVAPKPFWTQWALPWHLFWQSHSYDVLFTPGHYAPRWSMVPYVSSVMDLAFLEFPTQFLKKDVFQLREWTAYSVKRARKVVAISTFTKKQVMRVYHKQVKDVIVIPPAVEPVVTVSASDRSSALERLGATQPFLLYVGTLQPRKNIRRLVEAYEYLRTHGEGTTLLRSEGRGRSAKVGRLRKELSQVFQLVIAGKPGWLSDAILERIEVSPFRSDIVVTGFVNDLEKAALLSSAAAVVQVGLYEGFGIPPLEALQYGVIPVVANTTSLPEVVGKAGILVDPLDVKSIARGCAEALSLSAKDRAGMLKAGREQLKRYTWEKAGNTLIEVLKKVASGKA